MQEREARGGKPNRMTNNGYWKATGSPSYVYSSGNRLIGGKKTMVFYKGRIPDGRKTKWKMNEYKALEEGTSSSSTDAPKLRQELSLCRIYCTSKSLRAFDRRPNLRVISSQTIFPAIESVMSGPQNHENTEGTSFSSEEKSDITTGNWNLEKVAQHLLG